MPRLMLLNDFLISVTSSNEMTSCNAKSPHNKALSFCISTHTPAHNAHHCFDAKQVRIEANVSIGNVQASVQQQPLSIQSRRIICATQGGSEPEHKKYNKKACNTYL